MNEERTSHQRLAKLYPPSPPCDCEVCLRYCRRPGWWTVDQAARAIQAGFAHRMMLEIAPEMTFGVLSPAFRGCQGGVALNTYAENGCNFLKAGRCELHGTEFQPLECRFCHHDRVGLGRQCHRAIEKDWHTPAGQALIVKWADLTGFWARMGTPRLTRFQGTTR